MTDFLSRLALRAVGGASRVQPVVAPMFAPRRDRALEYATGQDFVEQSVEAEGLRGDVRPLAGDHEMVSRARRENSDSNGNADGRPTDVVAPRAITPNELVASTEAVTAVPTAPRLVQISRAGSEAGRRAPLATFVGGELSGSGTAARRNDSSHGASDLIGSSMPSLPAPTATADSGSNRDGRERPGQPPVSRAGGTIETLLARAATRPYDGPPTILGRESPGDGAARLEGARSPSQEPGPLESRPGTVGRPADLSEPAGQVVAPPTGLSNPVSSEPAIQVTIGRIEVRAMSAAPPPRTKRSTPSLSLDDYLKSRDGSGR